MRRFYLYDNNMYIDIIRYFYVINFKLHIAHLHTTTLLLLLLNQVIYSNDTNTNQTIFIIIIIILTHMPIKPIELASKTIISTVK